MRAALESLDGQNCLVQTAYANSTVVHVKIFSMNSFDEKQRISGGSEIEGVMPVMHHLCTSPAYCELF